MRTRLKLIKSLMKLHSVALIRRRRTIGVGILRGKARGHHSRS